jgi:hypothetical protein
VSSSLERWVAKLEGDGRLSCREMGGYVGGRWVAKLLGRWVAMLEGDGWLSYREMSAWLSC